MGAHDGAPIRSYTWVTRPLEYAPHALAVVLLVEDGALAGALAHCQFSAHLPQFSLLQEMQS